VEAVFRVALPQTSIAVRVGRIEGDLDELESILSGYVYAYRLVLLFCDWS
jgi:hypothetical protein